MKEEKQNRIDRRDFLKAVGAAGLGSIFASAKSIAASNEPNIPAKPLEPKNPQVPRRKLGKTGVEIPCLSLGTMFNLVDNQIILSKSPLYGVNYWDTSRHYADGNSEAGIAKYLAKNPDARKDLFLATKASGAKNVADVENILHSSMKIMNINYIDLYHGVHGISDPAQLTEELGQWSRDAKKRKLIRFFGLSTHKNMAAKCLAAAAKLDWIDVIMTTYSFRLMQDKELQDAVEACHKAGIGLIAMKTTGQTAVSRFQQNIETEEDKKLLNPFTQRGFSPEQAAIKAVLGDERFCSACVTMKSVTVLKSNVAAALDKTQLSQADMELFKQYAQATCRGYCAGCAHICDSALPDAPYVSDIMRYLMYYNSYGDKDNARKLFVQIPANVRNNLLSINYADAENRCPQRLPISKLVAEAVSKLA